MKRLIAIADAIQVRFRKVGQGDSIILESWKGGAVELGIIDCKNDELRNNAVISYLRYLKKEGVSVSVKFFILSHPHKDHCVGAVKLLRYLTDNDIDLHEFGSTFYFTREFQDSIQGSKRLINRIKEERNKMLTKIKKAGKQSKGYPVSYNTFPQFNPSVLIRCLAPDEAGLLEYIGKAKKLIDAENLDHSEIANMLSTFFMIKHQDKYILLTSDSEKATFENLPDELTNGQLAPTLLAVQVPHHGSVGNYCEAFWEKLNPNKLNIKAIISVGQNSYGHPSPLVLQHLEHHGYRVVRTDIPGIDTQEVRESRLRLMEVSKLLASGAGDVVEPMT